MKSKRIKDEKKARELSIKILVMFGEEENIVCDLALMEAFIFPWALCNVAKKEDAMAHCELFCELLKKYMSMAMDRAEAMRESEREKAKKKRIKS